MIKKGSLPIIVTVAAVVSFAIFIALAQIRAISVPYLTPTHFEFVGLNEQYPVNGSMGYAISLSGYGSNCIAFKAEMFRESSSGDERVAYFNQIQDCRKINIREGPYDYRQNFSYSGDVVLGQPGDYTIEVSVYDQITGQNSTDMRQFRVIGDSS